MGFPGPPPSMVEQLKNWALATMLDDPNAPPPPGGPEGQQLLDRTTQVIAALMWDMKTVTPNASAMTHMFMAEQFLLEDIGKALRTSYQHQLGQPDTYDRHLCLTVFNACLQDPDGWKLPLNLAQGLLKKFQERFRAQGWN